MTVNTTKKIRNVMSTSEVTRALRPAFELAFSLSDDGKVVRRCSFRQTDGAAGMGIEASFMIMGAWSPLTGWCAIDMLDYRHYPWHDEIVFTSKQHMVRGPSELFLMPRYPNVLLHFVNGKFSDMIDARLMNHYNPIDDELAIDTDCTMTDLPKSLRNVPEIYYVATHLRSVDAAFQKLCMRTKAANSDLLALADA